MTELTIVIDRLEGNVIIGQEKIIFKNVVFICTDDMEDRIEVKALPAADGTIYEVKHE